MNHFVEGATTVDAKVSARGQMSLPARARRRWGIEDGGEIGVVDLGDIVVLVPGGITAARRFAIDEISPAIWAKAANGFGDRDLANI